MFVRESEFGKTINGDIVKKVTVGNGLDLEFSVINRGATLQSFKVADRDGHVDECILGYDSVKDYEDGASYYGATIGRVANRIAGGCFEINGHSYTVAKNDGDKNCLHGGLIGFDKVLWNYTAFNEKDRAGVILNYISMDGEEGFPGSLEVTLTISLDKDNQFIMDYSAISNKDTVVNMTNHAYWNLSGFKENIYNHRLEIDADSYLPIDKNLIPTGEIRSVDSTPFDFRQPIRIGDVIDSTGGYDHNFNLSSNKLEQAHNRVVLEHQSSGRSMEVLTTEPGVQLYTGFDNHNFICLETQLYPDSINQNFLDSSILRAGDIYKQRTIHRFKIDRR